MTEGIKKVDDDWKRRAEEEKTRLQGQAVPPKSAGKTQGVSQAATTNPLFQNFVNTLATEALIFLGAIPHPQTGQPVFAPDQAKQLIDTLEMLDNKTEGNRSDEEDKQLKGVLHELRMAFVEAQKEAATAPAGDAEPA